VKKGLPICIVDEMGMHLAGEISFTSRTGNIEYVILEQNFPVIYFPAF
jgi:hypothetical protein